MRIIIVLINILALIIYSCENDEFDNSRHTSYFPDSKGLEWVYQRFDSLNNSLDTIRVKIVDDTIISGILYMVWDHQYKTSKERFLVSKLNDSVKIFRSSSERIDQLYLIPFEKYDGWVNPDYRFDTSFVSNIQNITIGDKNYSDVVLIERKAFCCNDYLIESIWIKPYLGLIKLERRHIILGPYKNETWNLIESNIE